MVPRARLELAYSYEKGFLIGSLTNDLESFAVGLAWLPRHAGCNLPSWYIAVFPCSSSPTHLSERIPFLSQAYQEDLKPSILDSVLGAKEYAISHDRRLLDVL